MTERFHMLGDMHRPRPLERRPSLVGDGHCRLWQSWLAHLAGVTAVTTRWIVERKQQAADRDYRPPPSQAAPEPVVGNPSPPEGSHANA